MYVVMFCICVVGAITQYKLFMNGIEVFSHASTREYLQENLQPWSLHTFRVVACNRKGCASSNEVQARTQEAPPEGRLVMEAKVEGARDVAVRYQPDTMVPWKANGKVYYDIYFDGIFYKDPSKYLNGVMYTGHISLELLNIQATPLLSILTY